MRRVAAWIAMGALAVVAALPLATPAPAGPGAPAEEFSAARAMSHVERVAEEPHPIGSPAIVRVRRYLTGQLRALGLDPELQTVTAPDWFGGSDRPVAVVNVLARIEGADPTGAIVLMGHYDTVPTTPGANDDAAAVATLLETGRALLAGPPLRNDVILLFTDGEEPAPRFGATAFVEQHRWAPDVGLVVNFEAVGGSGPSTLVETNGPGRALIGALADVSSQPAAWSFLTAIADGLGGSDTDFSPFRAEGIPGYHFAYLRGSPIYHTARDTPAAVSRGSLQHHGDHALALTRRFGRADLGALGPSGDASFFTVPGSLVIRYPAWWVLPLALLAAVALGAAVAGGARRGLRSGSALAAGVGVVTVLLLIAAVLTVAAWRLIIVIWPSPGVGASYLGLAVLVALSAATWFLGSRAAARRWGEPDIWFGVFAWWAGLALLTAIWLPGASYVFAWPALVGSLALLVPADGGSGPAAGVLRLVVVAGTALVLVVPALDVLFQLAQPRPGNPGSEMVDVVAFVAVMVVLVAGLVDPLVRAVAGRDGCDSRPDAAGLEQAVARGSR
ncbi:MAG: M20/M25/M40 family metallo-hydrolase [Acidimicrobiales bacterium]|nr:M20/M25/M40 family metallo-hydrolase [Acidimicrobiales bacterium]